MEANRKKYKLVIFDLDGTLLDTSEGLLSSTIYTIKRLGYDMPSREVLLSFVGPRIQDSFRRVYGLRGEELSAAAAVFMEHYKKGDVLLAKPYEGVYDVLNRLSERKIHMAVATNKRQDFTEELLGKYGFMPYMGCVCGTDMEGKLTKADLIRKCMDNFPGCSKDDSVMIGDSSYDAAAAREAGIDFIGITYGFEFRTAEDVGKWPNVGCVDNLAMLKM